VVLEVLKSSFLFFRGSAGFERAQVPALPGFGILFPRKQTILAGRKFTNHRRVLQSLESIDCKFRAAHAAARRLGEISTVVIAARVLHLINAW
jgi:hypothetical protein